MEHLRGAVRFADGIAHAKTKKIQTFIEIGPKPTLLGLGRASVESGYGTWLPGIKPDNEWSTLLGCMAELYVRGVEIDWQRFYPHSERRMQLPNYPWRYQRCWTDVVLTGAKGPRHHPLVHHRIDNASSSVIFESSISRSNPAYLDDHRVFGSVVFPASAFFEMAMVIARTIFKQDEVALTNVSIGRALVLTDSPATVQMVATPNADRFEFEISSRSAKDNEWISHTKGSLERRLPSPAASIDIETTLATFDEQLDIDGLTERFEARGLEYFPRFRAIEEIHVQPVPAEKPDDHTAAAFARIELPEEAILPGDSYRLHPVITDACFRIAEAMFPIENEEEIHLPFGISGFSCEQPAAGSVWVKATGRQQDKTRVVNLELFNAAGERIATVEDLTLRSVPVFDLQRAMSKPRASKDVLNEWLYELIWEVDDDDTVSNSSPAADSTVGEWLLLCDAGGVGDALARRMQSCGFRTHIARDQTAAEALINSTEAQAFTDIVHLWSIDARESEPDTALVASLNIVQSLLRAEHSARHWLITQGAQAVANSDAVSPWQTQFWGFGRTLQVEHPGLLAACIDLGQPENDMDLLVNEFARSTIQGNLDTEVAFRNGTRSVARLTHPEPMESPEQLSSGQTNDTPIPLELDPEASYLITGGVGALGLQVAQFLATAGARHLILTGRSGVSTDDQRTALLALEDAGVKAEVVAADIGNADHVARILGNAPRLRGIVHAAGVLDDGMLMSQTPERFRQVASPKVDGAWHLHVQTQKQNLSLDFFVLFSSVAAVIGSPGQSNYASANAFMDGLAHHRNAMGLSATAINWGPWADVGMAASEVVLRRLMHDGWQPMTATQGCDFIAHLLTSRKCAQAAVIPVDWATFVQRVPGASEWSTLKHLIPAGGSSPLTASAAEAAAQRIKSASSAGRVDLVSSYLLERIAQTLRVAAADLDEFAALSTLGIDSLTAVELRSWVQGDLDVELAVEQMFTTPSIRELAIAIDQSMVGGQMPAGANGTALDKTETVSQWIVCPQARPDARMRLVCFPYAGGGASAFKDWTDIIPDDIELHVVQLPGREERLPESLVTDMTELVNKLTDEMLAITDRPFAFLGHSMGAIIGYEVARRLRLLDAPSPEHMFLSARAAPQLENNSEPMRDLDNDAFIERLHGLYGAVPEAIRQSTELRDVFLPILRADVALLETHGVTTSEPLDCPITVFGGSSDPAVSATMLAGWQEHTSAAFYQHELPGDHFFIHGQRKVVAATIVDSLK